MSESLRHLFAAVCGQNPDHTWAPGGLLLPCCQRCTGLYVGALVALTLHLWLRPRMSGRFLQVHGLCLLQMLPFGFHWLPQGPALRTVTGLFFGYGVVTFLWLVPAAWWQTTVAQQPWRYWVGLATSLLLVPAIAAWGGKAGAFFLTWLALVGFAALAGLAAANIGLGLVSLARLCRRVKPRASA
jgi:uncharacterized membrane protein